MITRPFSKLILLQFLVDYLNNNFKGHNLLAFRPTGWAKNASPQYGGRISIVGEF